MNSGQSVLIIGAFVVLSTMTLNVNTQLVNTGTTGLEMEATLDAISIAQSVLDEVLTKDFDQTTSGGARVYTPTNLTPTIKLGTEGSSEHISGDAGVDTSSASVFESQTKFNDVDDYDGYVRKVWNSRFGWFNVTVSVAYVNEDDPSTALSSQSFYKRVSVKVNHPNLVKDSWNNVIPLVVQDLAVYRRYF